MSKKFIGFTLDPLRPINLDDKRKWERQGESRSYKLVSPDLDTDRQFATAQVKVTKAYSIEERLYIAGVANANIVDRVQERLDPVGLIAQDYLKNPQLLAHHSYHHPIGQVETIDVQDDGVHFSAWIGDPQKADLTDMLKAFSRPFPWASFQRRSARRSITRRALWKSRPSSNSGSC
jgi:hypothetical protein